MSFDNETVLTLSVQESVWFQKGQEVADVLSVQLTPDISINEEGDYVCIRGSLFLEGEYKPIIAQEDEYSLRDISPHRTVEDVVSREDGTNEFYHNFPVYITIPIHRVEDLNDIYITIESFDYELTDESNLKLIADITIGGLQREESEEDQRTEESDQQEVPIVEHVAVEEEQEDVVFEPFRLEVKREPQVEIEEEQEWEQLSTYSGTPVVEVSQDPIEEPKRIVEQEAPTIIPEPEPIRYQHVEEKPEVKQETPIVARAEEFDLEEEEIVSAEAYDEQYYQHTASNVDENALYLTKLFSREEEEEFSQLRMYIVQPGDTIESIASHYGVKVESMMRANSLEDAYVTVGKILYIPKGRKHHI
ncbi:MAG: stage VI sporulation protein D [Bacillaceae bacterium]